MLCLLQSRFYSEGQKSPCAVTAGAESARPVLVSGLPLKTDGPSAWQELGAPLLTQKCPGSPSLGEMLLHSLGFGFKHTAGRGSA